MILNPPDRIPTVRTSSGGGETRSPLGLTDTGDSADSPDSARPDATAEAPSADPLRATARGGGHPQGRRDPDGRVRHDPWAGAEEFPAWPPGPRLTAEVVTPGTRYVNLRPGQTGVMATVRIDPGDSLSVTLRLPESAPGDRVHVELSDGGRFADDPNPGRVYVLDKTRRIEIAIEGEERPGYQNLLVRQAGHLRILPIWVGPDQPLAPSDS